MTARTRNILKYCVLTASTIGPGSVAMCAKAGADYGHRLVWCVAVAVAVAWSLQHAAGRLTIEGKRSLGQAIRDLSPSGAKAVARHALTLFVLAGSVAYECNIFSGVASGVELLTDESAIRIAFLWLNGPLCCALLLAGSTDAVSAALGVVAFMLAVLFGAVVAACGLQPGFVSGLVPSFPPKSVPDALGLMGTTAVPLNLLLGSAIAKGGTVAAMREGVAAASLLTGLLSLLILAAGAEASPTFAPVHLADETASFELRHLAEVLQRIGGSAGVSCFAVGLYGAGISSALTVPLGSALAVEDLLGWRATPQPGEKRGESSKGSRSTVSSSSALQERNPFSHAQATQDEALLRSTPPRDRGEGRDYRYYRETTTYRHTAYSILRHTHTHTAHPRALGLAL
ncbi:hypothetical protein EMIHUDRAFT_440344 [Emiliania huxleyi CCMP1516]|uniref:Amino acid transporter transmembrane domain-containing protein n=2 Tax=Emiliania huxleyi TaxID=2903 RepID=A0A0D3KNY9_EMIH1|nr:hypothetical protein EMIHUDRAFT_440344 [Emiliania huxleyi CCMP1516]EOD37474.1 hypothetical protein EMIHUDRAFT_440344 [Emiliania huxleyi CCMP1516]|eukprot:XP_005789903.1 hypothetical protein EMIHUDRAFT_440344 [Emiliania huxleyi CCMP1516]